MLGLPVNATPGEVRGAYLRVCKMSHPDKAANKEAGTFWFKKVSQAYAVLSDVSKRRAYDQQCGHSGADGHGQGEARSPPGWQARVSKSTGEEYFYRNSDGHIQWQHPSLGEVVTSNCLHCVCAA